MFHCFFRDVENSSGFPGSFTLCNPIKYFNIAIFELGAFQECAADIDGGHMKLQRKQDQIAHMARAKALPFLFLTIRGNGKYSFVGFCPVDRDGEALFT